MVISPRDVWSVALVTLVGIAVVAVDELIVACPELAEGLALCVEVERATLAELAELGVGLCETLHTNHPAPATIISASIAPIALNIQRV